MKKAKKEIINKHLQSAIYIVMEALEDSKDGREEEKLRNLLERISFAGLYLSLAFGK